MTVYDQLARVLPGWYEVHKRDLPWRKDHEPYHVWLSEIMLQQTRVEAVKGYYIRFLTQLPTVEALAACDSERLHKLWEGLGYYSRVRNLQKAAQVIQQRHGGVFPGKYEDILALPGIGEYTAGAIASICFEEKTPAVDGNVLRLAARLTDDDTPVDIPAFKASVRQKLQAVYPQRAGDFTQALMELGATVCLPNGVPKCDVCPCREFCLAYQNKSALRLPVRRARKEKRQENMTVFVLSCDGRYALRKRGNNGLLAQMWEFPNVPGHLQPQDAMQQVKRFGLRPKELHRQLERSHIFTHICWNMRCYYVQVKETAEGFAWLCTDEIETDAALPTAFRQFWEEKDGV